MTPTRQQSARTRPGAAPRNLLLIAADQLSAKALDPRGSTAGATPTLDALAARGIRFADAYTPCPLCLPARAAFWTGRFPHETGVLANGRRHPVPVLPDSVPTLGSLFAGAGWETFHAGKRHDAGSLRGFRVLPEEQIQVPPEGPWPVNSDTFRDRFTTERTVEFLCAPHDPPFLAVADLNNPHNICQFVGAYAGPHTDPPLPPGVPLPPLPDNFRATRFAALPRPVQFVCCAHNRQAQAAGWTEDNYRHYLAAYAHYCRRLDDEVGRILRALAAGPHADNTLVVFFADHGDAMAARGLVTKHTTFYDETTRVPLIVAGPGVAQPGRVQPGLVSLLDLLPTLCDLAGIAAPPGLWGQSLAPALRADSAWQPHPYVAAEWHTEWGFTVEPGRMLRTPHAKYMRYLEDNGEELYDLVRDPGEIRPLAGDPAGQPLLTEHRQLLAQHLQETRDPFLSLAWQANPRWRAHPPGQHPPGAPAAPMVETLP